MAELTLEQLDKDIEQIRERVAEGNATQAELDELITLRERLKDASPEDWEAYRYLAAHLPSDDADDVLIVLKGLLLIESLVQAFVRRRVLNPDAIDAVRLNSSLMICLGEALCLPGEDPKWLWTRVRELNALRNKLAHKLTTDGMQERIDAFVREVDRTQNLARPTLAGAISRLYGMLKGLSDHADDPDFKLPT